MEKNIDENFIMENIGQLNQQLGQQTSSTPAIPSQVQFNLQPQIKQIPANVNVNNGPRIAPSQNRGPFIPQNQMNQVNAPVNNALTNGANTGVVACTVDPSCFQVLGFQLSKKTVYILIALIVLASVYYWWVRSKKMSPPPPMIMDKKREKKDKKSKKEESEKSESSSSSESKKSKSSK